MKAMRLQWISRMVALAALPLAGCATDGALGPDDAVPAAAAAATVRAPGLGACDELSTPEGSILAFRAYARGVQVYRWTGSEWAFSGPIATLYADAGGHGVVGTHFGGPTWKFNSGGFIVAALNTRCEVAPANIPWLLLDVVRNEGPGVFRGVTHIQRVNTVGGQAQGASGAPGEVRHVPYTAEYYFYRAP